MRLHVGIKVRGVSRKRISVSFKYDESCSRRTVSGVEFRLLLTDEITSDLFSLRPIEINLIMRVGIIVYQSSGHLRKIIVYKRILRGVAIPSGNLSGRGRETKGRKCGVSSSSQVLIRRLLFPRDLN